MSGAGHRRNRQQLPGRGHRVRRPGAGRLLGARGAGRAAGFRRSSRRSPHERGEALKVVKLNIDENQETAVKFNVMSIPTLMLFEHGEVEEDGDRRLSEGQDRRGARARPGVAGLRD